MQIKTSTSDRSPDTIRLESYLSYKFTRNGNAILSTYNVASAVDKLPAHSQTEGHTGTIEHIFGV